MSSPDWRHQLAERFALSLSTAMIVSATAYLCAWYEHCGYHYYRTEQIYTRRQLEALCEDIERYHKTTGKLPAALNDLEVVTAQRVRGDDAGQIVVDGWGQPFQYRVEADGYTLCSWGRDGKPGGAGLDADLFADQKPSAGELPTLWQFTKELDTWGIQLTCLLAGIIAFPICFVTAQALAHEQYYRLKSLVGYAVTTAFCVLAAVFMSALHLPTGH